MVFSSRVVGVVLLGRTHVYRVLGCFAKRKLQMISGWRSVSAAYKPIATIASERAGVQIGLTIIQVL
jgi:hypothetical protein